jgi:hypothetical protein
MPNTLIKIFTLSYDVYCNHLNIKLEFLPHFNIWKKKIYRHIMVKKKSQMLLSINVKRNEML